VTKAQRLAEEEALKQKPLEEQLHGYKAQLEALNAEKTKLMEERKHDAIRLKLVSSGVPEAMLAKAIKLTEPEYFDGEEFKIAEFLKDNPFLVSSGEKKQPTLGGVPIQTGAKPTTDLSKIGQMSEAEINAQFETLLKGK
jgi:hypothetical protein